MKKDNEGKSRQVSKKTINEEEIMAIIKNVVKEVAELDKIEVSEINEKTPLYGSRGYLDSLGLVSLIAGIEGKLAEKDINITIATERAFSRKISPFLTVKTLARFIEKLISE